MEERRHPRSAITSAERAELRVLEVDKAIRAALETAAGEGPDPRLDPAVLPVVEAPVPAATPEAKWPVGGLIILGLIAAVLGVGLYFAWPYIAWVGDKLPDRGDANGAACKTNRDCRSGVCDYGQCKSTKRKRGDRCDFDSQCTSDDCSRGLCN